jgi:hypothetical protein
MGLLAVESDDSGVSLFHQTESETPWPIHIRKDSRRLDNPTLRNAKNITAAIPKRI